MCAKCKVSPTLAERALAPDSPSGCGLANGSIANPHLNGDPGTIITFPGQ
jgi:hypothetical protein